VQKSAGKYFASFFFVLDGILNDFFPKGQIINVEYYSALLVQLKDILKKKCRGKVTNGAFFCTTMPWLTRHLKPRRNWPTWASSAFITQPYSPIWPCRTTTYSLY
jgi:hypothetical protein